MNAEQYRALVNKLEAINPSEPVKEVGYTQPLELEETTSTDTTTESTTR